MKTAKPTPITISVLFLEHHGRPDAATPNGETAETYPARSASCNNDQRKPHLVSLINSGLSTTAAAKETGIAIGTAMSWAAAAGLQTLRRPKILVPAVRNALIRDLRLGTDKKTTAMRHGISVETVTRTLLSEVGLHQTWKETRFTEARNRARTSWLALLQKYQAVGAKLMRAMDPAVYAWLFRNDRDWLSEHTPNHRSATSTTRVSSVKWDERDLALSGAVEQTALSLANDFPGRTVRLWHIYQALPDLKPKLAVLDRLPLTKVVLERALRGKPRRPSDDLFD